MTTTAGKLHIVYKDDSFSLDWFPPTPQDYQQPSIFVSQALRLTWLRQTVPKPPRPKCFRSNSRAWTIYHMFWTQMGDVIIVLEKSTENRPTDASLNDSPDNESKEENPEEKPQGVRIRVSSKHLALASPYFKRMLGPNWEEGKSLRATGSTSIIATDFDLDALIVVLNAMHSRQDHLPRKLGLEMLANVAVVVDYYQCHGVADMAKEVWFDVLKDSFPVQYSEAVTLWIWVAWVFSAEKEFELATLIAIRQCPGPFNPLGFPIPSAIISKLNEGIEAAMDAIYTSLDRLLTRFCEEKPACSFNCSAMLFGVLSFVIQEKRLTKDSEDLFFKGDSFRFPATHKKTFERMIEMLRKIESEEPKDPRLHKDVPGNKFHCGLRSYINSLIDDVQKGIAGLKLSTFQ